VVAGLEELAKKERDCHVRWAAALTLARIGNRSLLPAGLPQTDAEVLDQACLAGVEEDATKRRERLQRLILPETVFVERITEEEEAQQNGALAYVTHTRKATRALTQKDLETALEFLKQPAQPQQPSGYRELSREEGRMGEPEAYDLAPGKSKDGRRGLLRVLHRLSHVGGSC
jgi:hypothetical protein